MMRRGTTWRVLAVGVVVALTAVACSEPAPVEPGTGPTGGGELQEGGEIVVGAEQWPPCPNPINQCSSLSWGYYSVWYHILPRATELDKNGNYIAGPLITELPSLENGLITEDPFTITYNLNPEAVWEDGTPITSSDFRFTWLAILNTTGTYSTSGYDQIDDIDDSDPATVVIEFGDVYTPWADLFGSALGWVIKEAAFPDADPEKPDLGKDMKDEVPFSGGPWILDSWSKTEAVFSRNDNYWGEKAVLDGFTMIPITDQAAEVNALLSGEVLAIWPQPGDVSLEEQVSSDPGVSVQGGDGPFNDALWFTLDKPPMDDIAVREAFAYAVDRQSIIDAIIKTNNPTAEVNNCLQFSPIIGEWCNPVFSDFAFDPAKSIELLEGAGYECSAVPTGPCTKDGEPLELLYAVNTGNTRRELTQQLVKEKALEAGFDLKVDNYDVDIYFGSVGPKGTVHVMDYAIGGSPDPSATANFGCEAVAKAPDFGGGNWTRWCNEEASDLMTQADEEIDPAARLELTHQFQEFQRSDIMSLPMYMLPQISAWRSDQVCGPVAEWNETIYGLYYNIDEWGLCA